MLPPAAASATASSFGVAKVSLRSQVTSDRGDEWMHIVDDGGGGVVVSYTQSQQLYIARVADPLASGAFGVGTFGTISATLALVPISDIWHVYAYGYHWITYADIPVPNSGQDNCAIFLVCARWDGQTFQRVNTWLLSDPYGNGNAATGLTALVVPSAVPDSDKIVGNDSFLMRGPRRTLIVGNTQNISGTLVPFFIRLAVGTGPTITLASASYTTTFNGGVGGSGWPTRGYSVAGLASRSLVVNPDTLAIDAGSVATRTWVTSDLVTWAEVGITLTDPDYQYVMGTLQPLYPTPIMTESWLLTYRRRPEDLNTPGNDNGDIFRTRFTGTQTLGFTEGSTEALSTGMTSNRPHTLQWVYGGKIYLFTNWSSNNQQQVRIDTIT